MEEPRIPEEPAPPQDSASIAAEDDGVEIMTKKPRVRRPPKPAGQKPATAVPGTSAFPTARVAKVIKSDKDVQMCSKEAIFLISVATVRPILCALVIRERQAERLRVISGTLCQAVCRRGVYEGKAGAAQGHPVQGPRCTLCAGEQRHPGRVFLFGRSVGQSLPSWGYMPLRACPLMCLRLCSLAYPDVNPKPIATASTTEPRKSKPKPANIDLTTEDSAPVFDAVHEQDALASRSPAPPAQLATHSSSPETRRATRPGADGEIGDDDAVEGDVEMEADSMDVEE